MVAGHAAQLIVDHVHGHLNRVDRVCTASRGDVLAAERGDAVGARPALCLDVEGLAERDGYGSGLAFVFEVEEALGNGIEGDQLHAGPVGGCAWLDHLDWCGLYGSGHLFFLRCFDAIPGWGIRFASGNFGCIS